MVKCYEYRRCGRQTKEADNDGEGSIRKRTYRTDKIRDSKEGRQMIDTRDGKVFGYSYDVAETPKEIALKVRKLKKG